MIHTSTILFILAVILSVACTNQPSAAVTPPDNIICNYAYRSSVQVGIEDQGSLVFEANTDSEQSAVFAEMSLNATYDAGGPDNEHNLRVWVTDPAGNVLQSVLYQFLIDGGPQNQFVGGHGFTGLNYSYVSGSPAELQFWCEVN